ncbi:MAG: SRPBCC family protein [Candidatus Omnitrophica bacterium]|nr:SRPBCC family protein [Candidatus Omnitrophota bacterium]
MSDRSVKVSRVIKAKKWQLVRLITHVEDFPRFMPNVKQVSVFEKSRAGATTCWSVEVDRIPLSWKERDEFDIKKGIIRFRAFEGDLEEFSGEWRVRALPTGETEVTIEAQFKIGIPMIENIIRDAFAVKLASNFDAMLLALEERITMGRYKKISRQLHRDLNGFGVIGHPYNFQHLVRYFQFYKPDIKLPSREFIAQLFDLTPAYKSYDIKGFKSMTGEEANGYFIMCPIIPDMIHIAPEKVVEKVEQACRVAEKLNVGIVTLGGFTSIAGERYGKTLSSHVSIPITTGNTLTCAMTLDGIFKAAQIMEVDLPKAKVTVIGGSGDIGSTCARILAEHVSEITITGRNEKSLMETERLLTYLGKARIHTSTNNDKAIQGADIVLAAASASQSMIDFNHFKRGAVICDVGYPKNISYTACSRRDILIFSGGIAQLPNDFHLGFDIGMPSPRALYGCFTEALILDLEKRYENFSMGKGNITKERISFIRELGKKHGFDLAPFFWGNKLLTEQDLDEIRSNARAAV